MNTIGTLVSSSCVASVLINADKLTAGDAGLTLSYATQFTACVIGFFRTSTMLEVRPRAYARPTLTFISLRMEGVFPSSGVHEFGRACGYSWSYE